MEVDYKDQLMPYMDRIRTALSSRVYRFNNDELHMFAAMLKGIYGINANIKCGSCVEQMFKKLYYYGSTPEETKRKGRKSGSSKDK